ncbi:MAG TPA: porin [Gallionella sp.]|nr:porin [Gallionella sp.]
MQKKILVLALAAAVSAPAFADNSNVTIYGVANVSYDITNTGSDTAGNPGFSSNKVSSNTSRLGLKGSEDLGDGLSAIWQIESLIQIDNSGAGNGLATRNTFAGLSSNTAGTVLLGRHDTPYNLSTRKLDLFADGIADNRSILGGGRSATAATVTAGTATVGASFDGRQPDVVAYISPTLSGFTGAAAYVAGAEGQTAAGQNKGNAWSAAGWYNVDALYASLAYEVHNLGTAATGTIAAPVAALAGKKESAWKLGLSYKIDALTANFAYEKISDDFGAAGANSLGHHAYYLGGKYAFGNDAVKLAYSKAGSNATASTGARQISVGYDHSLSKRTTVYVQYTQLHNDANGDYQLSANGTGVPALPAPTSTGGSKPSAFSLGLKHTF